MNAKQLTIAAPFSKTKGNRRGFKFVNDVISVVVDRIAHERTLDVLLALSDEQLKDIGLNRYDFPQRF